MKLEIKAIKEDDEQINFEFVVRKPNGKGLKNEVIYFFDEDGDYELGDYSTALEERANFEFACELFDVDPDDVLTRGYEELKGKKKEVAFSYED